MKKLFFGIVVFLLLSGIALAGATWMISNSTEDVLNNAIVETNHTLERDFPFAKLVYKTFDKGIVKSTATTELQFDHRLFEQDFALVFQHIIYNGPVMMTGKGIKTGSAYITSTLDQESLSADAKAIIDALFEGREPFITGMLTGTDDKVVVDMDIAPLRYDPKKFPELEMKFQEQTESTKELTSLTVGGMSAKFSTDMAGTMGSGIFSLGEIIVDEMGGSKVTIAASNATFDMQEIYRGKMLEGTVNYVMPNILALFDGKSAALSDVSLSSSATNTGDGLNGRFIVDIASLKLPDSPDNSGSEYSFPESKLRMDVSIKGLDKESAKQLIDAASQLDKKQLTILDANIEGELADGELDKQTEKVITESLNEYFAVLASTVKAGLELNFGVDISNSSGISNLNLDIAYRDDRKLFELKTIRDLIEALKTDVNINVSKGMLAGTPAEEAIAMPVAMGFATEKAGSYETIAHLDKGELIVNGEVIPFLAMIGAAVNQPIPWEQLSILAVSSGDSD